MRAPTEHRRLKPLVTAMGIGAALLLVAAMMIGFGSLQQIEEIVASDLSTQQLILARSLAGRLADALSHVRRELTVAGYSPAIQYPERVAWASRMRFSMQELARYGAQEIRRTSADGKVCYVVALGRGSRTETGDFGSDPAVRWAKQAANKGRFFYGSVETRRQGPILAPMMTIAKPVYQESVDESHPTAPGGWTARWPSRCASRSSSVGSRWTHARGTRVTRGWSRTTGGSCTTRTGPSSDRTRSRRAAGVIPRSTTRGSTASRRRECCAATRAHPATPPGGTCASAGRSRSTSPIRPSRSSRGASGPWPWPSPPRPSRESAEEAMARGAFDFITKPFRKEQILTALDKALKWRALVRQNRELKEKLQSQGDPEKKGMKGRGKAGMVSAGSDSEESRT